MSPIRRTRSPRPNQSGVLTVEFALVVILVFTLIFGVIECGRLLWTWNAVANATREGARWASMCEPSAGNVDAINARVVQASLGTLSAGNVVVQFIDTADPAGVCTLETCQFVRVSTVDFTFNSVVAFVPLTVPLPPFAATARREAMQASCS